MAASLRNFTFTTLADKNDEVLYSDYVHSAIETWKIRGRTLNGGRWDYKAKIKHTQKDGQLSGNLSDELKIQFPYDRYYFWLGTRRNGDLKVHVDFGNLTIGGQYFNIFSNVKTGITFKNFAWRFGFNHFGEKVTTSTRLETVNSGTGCNFGLTNRTFFRNGQFFYGLVTSFNLDGFQARQYDAIVGFEKDNTNVYIEHTSGKNTNGFALGTITGLITVEKNDNTFGVEVANNFQNPSNSLSATLGAQTISRDTNSTIKAKINNNLDLELAYKKIVNSQLTITTSGLLALTRGAKMVDFSQYVPIPFGVQFDLNI